MCSTLNAAKDRGTMITFRELKPLLVQLTADKTAATATRSAAATSLAGLCFLGGGEMAEVSLNDSSILFPSLSDRHPSNPYVSIAKPRLIN